MIVVPDEIPDGTPVRVSRLQRTSKAKPPRVGSKGKKTAKRGQKKRTGLDKLIGIWKDRPDWKGKSTLQIAAELRQKSLGRKARG